MALADLAGGLAETGGRCARHNRLARGGARVALRDRLGIGRPSRSCA